MWHILMYQKHIKFLKKQRLQIFYRLRNIFNCVLPQWRDLTDFDPSCALSPQSQISIQRDFEPNVYCWATKVLMNGVLRRGSTLLFDEHPTCRDSENVIHLDLLDSQKHYFFLSDSLCILWQ